MKRQSNIELFRCVAMLLIVAWHWFIYTGAIEDAYSHPEKPVNWLRFALCGWGKTGINCFVLITGYFLYKADRFHVRKIVNLLLLILFYSVLTYAVGCALGAIKLSSKGVLVAISPFSCTRGNFVPNYLLLLIVAPFINALIAAMDRRRHLALLFVLVALVSVSPMLKITFVSDKLAWFGTVYCIGAFMAKYPIAFFADSRRVFCLFLGVLAVALCGMISGTILSDMVGLRLTYYLLFPETRPLSLVVAMSLFLVFRNMEIPHSSLINSIGASTFGVYLLSDGWLREYIWTKSDRFGGWGVILVFMLCSIVDIARRGICERFMMRDKDA